MRVKHACIASQTRAGSSSGPEALPRLRLKVSYGYVVDLCGHDEVVLAKTTCSINIPTLTSAGAC